MGVGPRSKAKRKEGASLGLVLRRKLASLVVPYGRWICDRRSVGRGALALQRRDAGERRPVVMDWLAGAVWKIRGMRERMGRKKKEGGEEKGQVDSRAWRLGEDASTSGNWELGEQHGHEHEQPTACHGAASQEEKDGRKGATAATAA